MKDFTDEQLRYLCDAIIETKIETESISRLDVFNLLNDELTRREELADLDFDDCDGCKL